MPLRRRNTQVFHRGLYRGQMETVTLLKRGDDQQEGSVTQYTLFQCLLPGTKVHGDFLTASKALYSGEAIEIGILDKVGSVTELSTTINHPILTTNGFVSAGSIKPGQDLVCDLGDVKLGPNNIKNTPITAEEIFESSRNLGFETIWHRPSVLDFHGDGGSMQGYVNIVRTDGNLGLDRAFQFPETRSEQVLVRGPFPSPRFSYSNFVLKSLRSTTTRSISGGGVGLTNARRQKRIFSDFSFAPRAKLNRVFLKKVSNGRSVNIVDSSKCIDAFASKISFDNLLVRKGKKKFAGPLQSKDIRFLPCPKIHPSEFHVFEKGRMADARIFNQISSRFSGKISLNKVVYVRRFHYTGPVYDLESRDGYYIASSKGSKVFVSNCRRGNLSKSGEAIQGDMPALETVQWLIPNTELRRVGVNYFNVLDRIVDKYSMWWQPEAGQNIELMIFDNYYGVNCLRIDPNPNQVLLGNPGVGL